MDAFEFNKIFSSILIALLVMMLTGLLGDSLIAPETLEKNAYPIEGVSATGNSSAGLANTPARETEPLEPLLASADIEAGKKVAKKCTQCHTLSKGGPNKIGPNLWGVLGAKIAQVKDYTYSKAMKSMEGTWDIPTFNKYLHKPRNIIPGTKMSFAGLKRTQDRANLYAYLNTLKD